MMSAAVMFTLAYRTSTQEVQHHEVSLSRSAEATAREIELYIGGLQRVLSLFAVEQQALLYDVIKHPAKIKKLQEKIALHFPKHLAFAVSDPQVTSPLISQPELFGESCRANLDAHSQNDTSLEPVLFLHDSGSNDSRHFDVMATIRGDDANTNSIGIVFVSFRVNDLIRLLTAGSASTHTLLLENKDEPPSLGSRHIFLTADTGIFSDLAVSTYQQPMPNYTIAIGGTSWRLQGFINESSATRVRNSAFIQTALGLIALLIAGATAWRSIEQEKVSHNRTSIVLASVDADRKRIARELHDEVLSDISHSKRLLMDIEPDNTHQNATRLTTIKQSVDSFSTSIRTAINDLYPHTLDNLGLCKAVESFVQSRCATVVSYDLVCDRCVDEMLEPVQKLHIYRIVTELMSNALKHASCDAVSLSIRQVQETVVVRFEDNGCGFDPALAACSGGHGLNNIDSRILALRASGRWSGNCFKFTVTVANHDR